MKISACCSRGGHYLIFLQGEGEDRQVQVVPKGVKSREGAKGPD